MKYTIMLVLDALAALFCIIAPFLLIAAFCAAAATTQTVGLVQYASDNSVEARRYTAEPGVLLATEGLDGGSNAVVSLTIGTPDAMRVPVVDRMALRRTPVEPIDYPDFYIELGDCTTLVGERTVRVFDGYAVAGTGMEPNVTYHTRRFRVVPLRQRKITYVSASVASITAAGYAGDNPEALVSLAWAANDDGSATVAATVQSYTGTITYTVTIAVGSLRGMDSSRAPAIDDLTESDYLFLDQYGQTSLGGLRPWIHAMYDPYKADNWAHYQATEDPNLAGRTLRLNRNARISTGTTTATNDTVVLWHGGTAAIKSVSAPATNGTFRIIGMEMGASAITIYTDTSAPSEPYAQTCVDIVSADWTTPQGQSTALTTYGGEPAYAITVPNAAGQGSRFFRAVAAGAVSESYVCVAVPMYAQGGVAVQSPDGSWWRLTVSNEGAVSATKITNLPDGLSGGN